MQITRARIFFSTYKIMRFYNKYYFNFIDMLANKAKKLFGIVGVFALGLILILPMSFFYIPYIILKRTEIKFINNLTNKQLKHYRRLAIKLNTLL